MVRRRQSLTRSRDDDDDGQGYIVELDSAAQTKATSRQAPDSAHRVHHRVTIDRPDSASAKSVKVAPGRFSNGFGLKPVGANGATASSKRSDSIDLTHAEDGAFLSAIDGHPNQADGSGRRNSAANMSMVARALKGRKLLLVLAIFVIISVAILGPSERRNQVVTQAEKTWNEGLEGADNIWDHANNIFKGVSKGSGSVDPKPDNDPHMIDLPHLAPQKGVSTINDEAAILENVRKMPAVHPDPKKTTQCSSNNNGILDAHHTPRPTVQYGIMIDAGSTGSRVHVYRFNFCKDSPELEHETFEMLQPGLSSFKADARGAADSLKPLLQTALRTVPENLQGCTPISVKATAGLRLLGADLSANILQAIRDMLQNEYPFPIADGPGRNGIEIMEGRDEGVFAWITVNYLLNRIGAEQKDGHGSEVQTAAVMDLGGASTQIVFEPIYPSNTQGMHPGEHVYELNNFGGKKYTLYQNSYLGYGLMEARKSINSLSYLSYFLAHPKLIRTGNAPSSVTAADVRVPSPCFTEGRDKEVDIRVPGQEAETKVTMFGTKGGYEACKRLVEVIMDKDAVCTKAPCSFGGVYQPSLMTAFAHSPIVALSYFYDRISPFGLDGTFPLSKLTELTEKVCSPSDQWPKHFGQKGSSAAADNAWHELEDRPESCLDFTFLTTLLRLGYELDETRSVTVAKKLANNELGWCLGAQLQVLQDGVICKKA